MACLQRLSPFFMAVLLAIVVASEGMSTGKNADSMADSSITSYSSVVIHHPQGKKTSKESEEGRSRAYFKVKRLKTQSDEPAVQGDFRPSTYYPEANTERYYQAMERPQFSQKPKEAEYKESKSSEEDQDIRKIKQKEEDRSSEESNWRQNFRQGARHQPSRKQQSEDNSLERESRKDMKQSAEDSDESMENARSSEIMKNEDIQKSRTKQEDKMVIPAEIPAPFRYDFTNAIPAIDLTHPFEALHIQPRVQPIPPPGMSPELIQTLLSQQPQTFDSEQNFESKKKSKSQNFRVGYSIGFGGDEIVVGKPKDVRLHINGKNSIWKTLTNGVEMSEEIDKSKPMSHHKAEDSKDKSSDRLLKNDVYYMNNYKLDTSVPTTGRNSFNHAQALTNSNAFDFSNAVDPVWVQQQAVELDMSALYQPLGYPQAVPVYIQGPKGTGAMVQAFVIPVPAIQGVSWSPEGHPIPQHSVPLPPALQQPIAIQPVAQQSLHLQPNTHETLQLHHNLHQNFQTQPNVHHQAEHMQRNTHQPIPNQPKSHQHLQLQSGSHQSAQSQATAPQPIQLHPEVHQPFQLQSAAHAPFHLVPLQFAHVIPMNEPHHQSSIPAVPMPMQLKAHVQQIQPMMQQLQRSRMPKARDSLKLSSFDNTPIVVSPGPNDQAKLQQELNAILADEMKRKNHRHPSVGLRPPMHF